MTFPVNARSRGAPARRLAMAVASVLVAGGVVASACGSITAVSSDGGGGSAAGGTSGGAGGGGGANPDGGALDGPVDAPVTAAEACRQQAVAICDALEECATIAVKFFYVDKPVCVTRQMLGCMTDQAVPGTTRTPADILGCTRDIVAASCANLLASKIPDSCLVKPGPQASGTVCGSDWQCQSAYCQKDATCGRCVDRGGAGAACTVDAGCMTGLACANNVCVAPATLAMACDNNHPCRSDMYCTKAILGTCQLKVGLGAPCADSDKACDIYKSVACNPFTKMCETFNVAAGGDACGIVSGALTVCVDLGPCPGFSLLQAQGVCANLAADGAACGDAAAGVKCLPPASCVVGTCQLPSVPNCQ
jgi:hypothetical protein